MAREEGKWHVCEQSCRLLQTDCRKRDLRIQKCIKIDLLEYLLEVISDKMTGCWNKITFLISELIKFPTGLGYQASIGKTHTQGESKKNNISFICFKYWCITFSFFHCIVTADLSMYIYYPLSVASQQITDLKPSLYHKNTSDYKAV